MLITIYVDLTKQTICPRGNYDLVCLEKNGNKQPKGKITIGRSGWVLRGPTINVGIAPLKPYFLDSKSSVGSSRVYICVLIHNKE